MTTSKLLSCLLHAINQKDIPLTINTSYIWHRRHRQDNLGKTDFQWSHVPRLFSSVDLCAPDDVWLETNWQLHNIRSIKNKERDTFSTDSKRSPRGDALANKKIYIVLDDLLESKPSKLYSLKAMLNVGNGSKVIVFVTTRDKHIADKICTVEPYKIPLFTNDMCWTIIKQKVNFEARPYKDQLETVGMEIALKCGGFGFSSSNVRLHVGIQDVWWMGISEK